MAMFREIQLSHTLVKELLDYDPETGEFRHKVTYGGQRAGEVAGSIDALGYKIICVLGYHIKGHRLAWFYVNGEWPSMRLDHKDGCSANNAISNLRLATPSENKANEKLRKDNSSGLKGIRFHKPNQAWQARISKEGKRVSLGYYATKEEAHAAYMIAAERLYGEFARSA